jgi:hypothetical protein
MRRDSLVNQLQEQSAMTKKPMKRYGYETQIARLTGAPMPTRPQVPTPPPVNPFIPGRW